MLGDWCKVKQKPGTALETQPKSSQASSSSLGNAASYLQDGLCTTPSWASSDLCLLCDTGQQLSRKSFVNQITGNLWFIFFPEQTTATSGTSINGLCSLTKLIFSLLPVLAFEALFSFVSGYVRLINKKLYFCLSTFQEKQMQHISHSFASIAKQNQRKLMEIPRSDPKAAILMLLGNCPVNTNFICREYYF